MSVTPAIDLTDFGLWMTDPHPVLQRLRETDPVYLHEAVPGSPIAAHPFWALTRYSDVQYVSRHPELFSSADGIAASSIKLGFGDEYDTFAMIETDDPLHAWVRTLVSKAFTPRLVAQTEPEIRALAGRILDELEPRRHEEIDFVAEVSRAIPEQVIASMLGVPKEDAHLIGEWTDGIANLSDLAFDFESGTATSANATAAVADMFAYLERMQVLRAEHPADDLVTRMLQAEVNGEKMSLKQQRECFFLLSNAGNDTTRNTISAGVKALAENPDQRAEIIADQALLRPAIEEMLRFGTVVTHFRRTATEEVTLGDKTIKRGDWVVMFYTAANRDPEVFTDPHRFDIHRTPNDHLAFGGGGPHFCLGAPLARLELRVFFEELLRRYPHFAVTGEAPFCASNLLVGYTNLPVVLDPR